MDGGFERANVLLATAKSHRLEEPARDAYIAVAEKLGSHEQGQVFAALVKSVSRKWLLTYHSGGCFVCHAVPRSKASAAVSMVASS